MAMVRRVRIAALLVGTVAAVIAVPCAAMDAISRAHTVYNLPDVPPGPITEACSRPSTVYNLPDVPPPPLAEALSRAITVFNLPDDQPPAITEAISRALTVLNDPLSIVPGESLPKALVLHLPQPNPFNPRTTIKYDLPEAGPVRLSVVDVSCNQDRTLVAADPL